MISAMAERLTAALRIAGSVSTRNKYYWLAVVFFRSRWS